jgi:hypothetical protein
LIVVRDAPRGSYLVFSQYYPSSSINICGILTSGTEFYQKFEDNSRNNRYESRLPTISEILSLLKIYEYRIKK